MIQNKKLIKKKVHENWIPKLKQHYEDKGVTVPSDEKLRKIAELCHTRKLYETATLGNTVGRGNFAFGNNPMDGTDTARGSGEVFQNLFGVFVDAAAATFGMDLLPNVTMSKSSINVFVAEPVYAGGRIESADDKPLVVAIKIIETGTAVVLSRGTTYTATEGNAGNAIVDLIYAGLERVHGYAIFRIGQQYAVGTDYTAETLASCFDTGATGSGIYVDISNHWTFDNTTLDYVSGFNNFIAGFSGAGGNDDLPWYANRNTGSEKHNTPMTRDTGQRKYYRSMGIRYWSRNYSAQTIHLDVEYTTEEIQDLKMDHDVDALELGDSVLQDQLSQAMNEHILGTIYANGWENQWQMNQASGFNMNAHLGTTTGAGQSFYGKDNATLLSITGPAGSLPGSGAISENLSSLQRRVITRIAYASAVCKYRSRQGRGDTSIMNGTFSTALQDVKGYTPSPFENNLGDSGVELIGTFNKISVYEDGVADLNDERISVFRKGSERDAGLKLCLYLMAEKIGTIAEGTMAAKEALKSRYVIAEVGSEPQLNYMTFTVQQSAGYKIV